MDEDNYYADKAKHCREMSYIPADLYEEYDIMKGLRDRNGNGVRAGITNISRVIGTANSGNGPEPCEGRLTYRGYDINDIIGFHGESKFLFEETAYLLLFGSLPDESETETFRKMLAKKMELPGDFVKDFILRESSHDVMNTMARGVLGLSAYDPNHADNSIENVIRQCMEIISRLPMLAIYGYHSHMHYDRNGHLVIFRPDPSKGMAENIMLMLRPAGNYSQQEIQIMDIMLALHMEHGGGNNSTFTARVVASSGSDTYSVIAAALLSLKGPKHGGANIKVVQMLQDIKEHVPDTDDKEALRQYLTKIIDKDAFDGQGLIYGMGHAVYTISDPRAQILKDYAGKLAASKGREKDMRLINSVVEMAPDIIRSRKKNAGSVCANVDMYSGFVCDMLGVPVTLYTPLFAMARAVGWSAHRIEELITSGKIIRPKYISIAKDREFVPLEKRDSQSLPEHHTN